MEFENQINNYPGCKNCKLVEAARRYFEKDPNYSNKHVVLIGCEPKLPFFGRDNATMSGMVTELGRVNRLMNLTRNLEATFYANKLEDLTVEGSCIPLSESKK
jgi:hypothetical protein